jgi:hypothetical protein
MIIVNYGKRIISLISFLISTPFILMGVLILSVGAMDPLYDFTLVFKISNGIKNSSGGAALQNDLDC